jgi:serine/threonine protein kinase
MATDVANDKTISQGEPGTAGVGQTPTRLGRYTLKQRLGVGGMAEVYLAEQDGPQQFKKRVVIKRILPSLAADASFVAMFVREAQVAARLTHMNVVQIYELGEQSNADGSVEYFIAMEHIDGLTLQRLAKASWAAGGAVPVAIVLRTCADAARGLHAAHTLTDDDGKSLALVHRDISPDNLMISKDGVTKVLDFGIAKGAPRSDAAETTRTGQLRGKVPYLAPEQVSGQALDGRTDLWSLGVSMYWLLCGERPFDRASDFHTMAAILSDAPKPPRELNPAIPAALEELMLSMMAKEPAQRPASGADVADALEGLTPPNSNAGRKPTVAFLERFAASADAAGNPLSEPGDNQAHAPPSPPAATPPGAAERSVRTPPSTAANAPPPDAPTTSVAPWPAAPTESASTATPPAVAKKTPAEDRVVGKHPVVAMLAPARESALFIVGLVMLLIGGGGFALYRWSLTWTSDVVDAGSTDVVGPVADVSFAQGLPDAGFVALFADAGATAVFDPGPTIAPVSAPSDRWTVRARAPTRIEWRSERGALLGRGPALFSVPKGTTAIVAVDPKRRIDVKMPLPSGGLYGARTLDYDKLPSGMLVPKQVAGTKIFIGSELVEGSSPVRVVAGVYNVRITRGTKILSMKKIEFASGATIVVDAAKP